MTVSRLKIYTVLLRGESWFYFSLSSVGSLVSSHAPVCCSDTEIFSESPGDEPDVRKPVFFPSTLAPFIGGPLRAWQSRLVAFCSFTPGSPRHRQHSGNTSMTYSHFCLSLGCTFQKKWSAGSAQGIWTDKNLILVIQSHLVSMGLESKDSFEILFLCRIPALIGW